MLRPYQFSLCNMGHMVLKNNYIFTMIGHTCFTETWIPLKKYVLTLNLSNDFLCVVCYIERNILLKERLFKGQSVSNISSNSFNINLFWKRIYYSLKIIN